MIDSEELKAFIGRELEGSDYFLVDVAVTPGNEIRVEIDSDSGVDIEHCERLTRRIEEAFSRDEEDYELEVGSAGLTSPFRVLRQYQKNIGNKVEVLAKDGKKYRGVLKSAGEEGFVVVTEEKVRREGEKRPHLEEVEHEFRYDEVKKVNYYLEF